MEPKLTTHGAVVYCGDVKEVLQQIEDGSVNCVVTSPPYWGLRDYGVEGQIGLESTIGEYIEVMVEVFREVRRVLAADGTLWLNLGDSYYSPRSNGGVGENSTINSTRTQAEFREAQARRRRGGQTNNKNYDHHPAEGANRIRQPGFKPKDLIGQAWRVAFALQEDGWYLRQDIIWHKPNPMPESVSDRCTKAHEYIFLLSKSERYYYDADAIKEPISGTAHARGDGVNPKCAGWQDGPGSHSPKDYARAEAGLRDSTKFGRGPGWRNKQNESFSSVVTELVDERNKRSVWTVTTQPYPGAHFATFPPKLITPCILAGSPEGGTVLDPFHGSGTTGMVALEQGRKYIGVELNPEYIELSRPRLEGAAAQPRLIG